MALTVIKPSGIETSGNYTVNGMNVSANASVANLSVTNSANLGAVGNVIITGGTNGYVLQTDGSGTLSWVAQSGGGSTSNISNGNSNVNIPSANGNINFSAVGNTVMVISGTGVNVAGTLNTGSGVITGNGNGLSSLVGANVTGQVANSLIAGTVYTNAQPNITSVGTLTSLTVTGNVTGGNLVTAGKVYASEMLDGGTGIYLAAGPSGYINFFTTGGDKATITDTGNIVASNVIANSTIFSTTANISANVNAGNANLGNLVTANFFSGAGNNLSNIQAANISGQVANALVSGTVYTNAQPNITSVGTLTSLSVTGNISAGNANLGNNASANFFTGNGIYLTGITTAGLSNGNSNVNIPSANGNVNISAVGNANVLVITGTGANISGTANITGNLVAGNISAGTGTGGNITGANLVSANFFTGTLTTAAQPNITSVGTLTSLSVTGNIAGGNLTTAGQVVATGNVSGNFFIGNGSQLTGIDATAIQNGNSNVRVLANANVTISSAGNANILVVTGTGVNVAGTLNTTGNATVGNLIAGAGTGGNITGANLVSANFFTGTLTTAAQPNITSVGTLTSLSVTGNITGGNANLGNAAIANFFIGSGNNLSNIQAANISGQVANALIAGTVYTNAQPNITSVGTLTDISVSGNGVFGGNLTVNGTLTYINSTTLSISDPIINLQTGPNGAAPVANTGKDVGTALNYYDTSAKIAWMGWDVSNAEISFGSNVSISSEVVTFTELANIRSGNASLGNNVAANFFIGSGNNLSNIQASNITGQVANALISGTVYTNAQPNITSVGSLTGLTVSNATGIVDFTTTANVTLGAVANLHISGGTNGYVLSTDGSSTLSWVAQSGGGSTSNISNGNSNVSIPSANGNINFSAVGNANVVVITGTGANISGTANITGNVALSGANVTLGAVANLHISGGSNTYVLSTDGSGNLSWSSASGTNIAVDDFTGNGVQTAYTLTATPANINYTLVSIAGTFQPRTVYSLTGNVITFSSAPPNTAPIEVTTFTTGTGGGGGITAQDLLSPFLLMGA